MKTRFSRRSFLQHLPLTAGAVAAARAFPAPAIVQAAGRSEKLNCVVIGCGVRGGQHLKEISGENLVAIVDVCEKQLAMRQRQLAAARRDR